MFEKFLSLDVRIQAAVISAFVSIVIFILGSVVKFLLARYSINFRLNKEFHYSQRKQIKETFAESKTPLLKAAEDIDHRLWNLKRNITSENWLNIPEAEWCREDHYYLRSTVYRFSTFYHWLNEAEKSLYSLDSENADRRDSRYINALPLYSW